MDIFNQDFFIPHSEENRNIDKKQDSHDDPMMQNAPIKQDAAYHPSGYDEKKPITEPCGSSQPAHPDASGKDWASNFIIIDSGESLSSTPSASSTSTREQALMAGKPTDPRTMVARIRSELVCTGKINPRFQILDLNMKGLLEFMLVHNKHNECWPQMLLWM